MSTANRNAFRTGIPFRTRMASLPCPQLEVRKLFGLLAARWAAGDAHGYAALFSPDAHHVASDGVERRGRDAIASAHRLLFQGPLRGSTMVSQITAIDVLGSDVAVVHAYGYIVERGRKQPKSSALCAQTLVAQQRDGGWQCVALHHTRLRPLKRSLRALLPSKLADALSTGAARLRARWTRSMTGG